MDMTTMSQKGAALLDEHVPDWYQHINREALNMGDTERCILGQVFGDYFSGCSILDLPEKESYGYDLLSCNIYPGWNADLKRAWLARIQERRAV